MLQKLSARALAVVLVLILLLQGLSQSLPVSVSTLWVLDDFLRAVSFLALSTWVLSSIPYRDLREKCAAAAVFGYAVADVVICGLWYIFGPVGYAIVVGLQVLGFTFPALWYLYRSYSQESSSPEMGHIYCLRKRPDNLQGLLIAIAGMFGPYGEYALYCKGFVYRFARGVVVKELYIERPYLKYHAQRGRRVLPRDIQYLDSLIGTRWSLFGDNCLTIFGAAWKQYKR